MNSSMNGKAKSRYLGVGLECPQEVEEQEGIDDLLTRVGVVEFICEGMFLGRRKSFLDRIARASTPVVGHSIELSIGSAEPLKTKHLDQIKRILGEVNTVVYSDHLCMTEADGVEIGQLTTLPWTWPAVDVVCRKVDLLQNDLPWPFMLENITNRFVVPGNELSEAEFINAITARTGCGLLLDVTNLYTNAVNFNFDPYQWFEAIDKASVKGIHLAGGEWEEGVLYDTHSRPVCPEVWELFRHVLKGSAPEAIVVEWDQDAPTISRLLEEVAKAEDVYAEVRRGASAPSAADVIGELEEGRRSMSTGALQIPNHQVHF